MSCNDTAGVIPAFGNSDPENIRRWLTAGLFAVLLFAQTLVFLFCGTTQRALAIVLSLLVLQSALAITCAGIAFRRARGIAAMFWLLFILNLVILIVPLLFQTFDTIFSVTTLPEAVRSLLYCLYGAPILMMLFLPNSYGGQVKSEIFIDLFQIAVVVAFVYSAFFFIPVGNMLPAEALRHNVTVSDEQSFLLFVAAVLRLKFARLAAARDLLRRLVLFLLVCAIVTFIGDWISFRHYVVAEAWFNLGWAIPQVAAGLLAFCWKPIPNTENGIEAATFVVFLGSNLVLVAMLSGIHLLMDRWKQATGSLVANIAVVATLAAFTLCLALTQFSHQKEILHRQASQQKLIAANHQISSLLEDARKQTVEITQISELGSLLQACTSLPEVFRLLPERLRGLFPGASGCVSLLSPSRNHLETVVSWGPCPPTGQIFAPEECWALRRGRSHKHPRGASGFRCSHLMGEGASVCLPLVGNGEAIGTIAVQNHHDIAFHPAESEGETNAFARRCQIAAAVAEHLAFAISNLNLREALRLQAVRDSLTGLYNRRYMQEFLDRELHSARRKQRPLAVLMLDLDHFKRFNDTFGHSAGDMALAAVGSVLLRCVRADDIACRYGGEEFSLILPECSLAQATLRAEEIRKRIREISLAPNGQAADPLTVSVGVAAFDETTDRVDLLMKFADDALYRAKRAGRNRVIAARPAVVVAECESKTNQHCDSSADSSPRPDSVTQRHPRTGGKTNSASASSK